MKKFAFHLQTVLDVRRIREDLLRAELAVLCHRERQEECRLADLRHKHIELQERVTTAPDPLTGAEVLAAGRAAELLSLAIQESCQQRERLSRQRMRKAEETQEAACHRKMMEKLREKSHGRYLHEVASAAERLSDELCGRKTAAVGR